PAAGGTCWAALVPPHRVIHVVKRDGVPSHRVGRSSSLAHSPSRIGGGPVPLHHVSPLLAEWARQREVRGTQVVGSNQRGTSACTRVPLPGELSIRSVPPNRSTRSRMPRRPKPSALRIDGSKPIPSSLISSETAPPPLRSATRTRLACACFS